MARPSSNENSKEDQQLVEKLVSVRRVTKVVKGGKTMRFSALVVVGDGRGRVGYANGKAREVPDAVRKASEKARKAMIRVPLREGRTLHHDVHARVGASRVFLRTASAGTGVIAGGAMRAVFEALGLHDVVSKSVGTPNYHNVVRATIEALKSVCSPRQISTKLGKKLSDIVARRDTPKAGAGSLELTDANS
ncbi:30S ribosomal protein S5 [Candidatus Finniella inopinata]|uniref:Small ribosomal subunit protein uS5 n=1 Tax=Candidatus Finniella inopinata TaxID=1696036 RepID=A0A4Q7DHN1_9PROT|nr:30S ribosomal protein S5 [Candidatus Finniella inopinata]RZI46263.1 30S ribosomal protein S5 [Candidatus Finniella inopinata]